ncbi:CpaD family pilus assembly lipoprotein [Trinickia sp.]|uniref:CpaD family pilus assembly lipoprotein n=1 Tax=Trinickia sp. TaxID=2571163 RepID=UPI003F7D788E
MRSIRSTVCIRLATPRVALRRALLLALPFALLGGCMSTPPRLGLPDASIIRLRDGRALPPDCAPLVEHSDFLDAGAARPDVAFGCATYTNLAAMLVRGSDLTDPVPFGGPDADVAADAVRRYETGKVMPLQSSSTSSAEPTSNGNK